MMFLAFYSLCMAASFRRVIGCSTDGSWGCRARWSSMAMTQYIRPIFQAYVREFPLMIMLGVFFSTSAENGQDSASKFSHAFAQQAAGSLHLDMGVSNPWGYPCIPTSSILIRCSILNKPFLGVPLFMETHIWGYTIQYIGDDHSIMVNPTYTISQPVDQPVEKKTIWLWINTY